ncbi:MAG: hypothetical protein LBJ01_08700 [Tannerella sp.]|nr:hypothetical protein [Tannerella sp.]
MEQEANYASGIVCLSLVYLYCSNFMVKEQFTFIFMLTAGMIAVHAGFYGFYFLAIGILICFQDIRVLKSGWRTGFAVLIVLALTVYILKSQIVGYLFPPDAGNGDSDFTARSVLYRSALDLLKDFFPFGSGFASFATEISGKYYSQIYVAYGLNSMDGFSPRNWHSVTASYYPSLVQFGVSGILLYLFFWIHSAGKALVRLKREGDIQRFVIILIIISFVFIENISDTFFSSNKGFFMMMFLGLLAGRHKTDTGKALVKIDEEPVTTKKDRLVEKTVTPPEAPDVFRAIPEASPVEKSEPENGEPVTVVSEPEDEEYDDEYDEDEEDTDISTPNEVIEDMQQIEVIIPKEIEYSEEEDNEFVKREEEDMVTSEPEEKILEIPSNDVDFNDDFPIFEPLLDETDAEWVHETTENKPIQDHSEPEKQNGDDVREKPAAKDEETDEDDAPISYII